MLAPSRSLLLPFVMALFDTLMRTMNRIQVRHTQRREEDSGREETQREQRPRICSQLAALRLSGPQRERICVAGAHLSLFVVLPCVCSPIQRCLWCKRDPVGYGKARAKGKIIQKLFY